MSTIRRSLQVLAILGAGALALPPSAFAQAWVPEKGSGSVSVAVQELNVKKHYASTTLVDAGHINTVVVLADVTYGVTDKIAVDLAVPFVSSAYAGTKGHPGTSIDNGDFHSAFTDLRFSVRYNVTRKGAVFTPYIGSIVPSHDYAFYGHSASGERLRELQVGTFVAKLFTSGVPGLFLSGRAAYGFVEKVQDISHNRSMGDLEAGYFFTPTFRAFAMTGAQYTHGGIQFPLGGLPAVDPKYKTTHDIVQQVNYLHAGGGFAYSITDAFDLFGSFTRQVAGRNGHALNRGITVGVSWSFTARPKMRSSSSGASASGFAGETMQREGSLSRCICQKSGT